MHLKEKNNSCFPETLFQLSEERLDILPVTSLVCTDDGLLNAVKLHGSTCTAISFISVTFKKRLQLKRLSEKS